MKSLTSLAVLGLLLFACKLCSFTGNNNHHPTPTPTPVKLMYARDFIKPELGRFILEKSYDKEEVRKTASGFALRIIDKSNDAAGGQYKLDRRKAVLMACSFLDASTPASLVDEIENDMRRSSAWRTVTNVPRHTGKRIDGVDTRGTALSVWCNDQWLFLAIGERISDASALANAVGY
jgi:hypothetical protein